MKRSEVRDFIESGVAALSPVVSFRNGRITEFNSESSNEYPFSWLESLEADTTIENSLPYDDWKIVIHIAKKDAIGSSPEQYEAIIDQCDEIAQQLVKNYNDVIDGFDTSVISGVKRVPFHHLHADDTSGVILSFTLKAPDTTNLC